MAGMTSAAEAAWASLMQKWGEPLTINSAYRDPAHNARVGGAKNSQHTHGNAYDVDVSRLSRDQRLKLIRDAREAGFRGIGVYDNALHFDVGPERAWGPSHSRDSLPEWAAGVVGAPVGSAPATEPQNALAGLPVGDTQRPFVPRTSALDPRDFMVARRNALAPIQMDAPRVNILGRL